MKKVIVSFFAAMCVMFFAGIMSPTTVLADEPTQAPQATQQATQGNGGGSDIGWITEPVNPDDDVFGGVTEKVAKTSKSAYRLMTVIAGAVFFISMMLCAVLLMLQKRGQSRGETMQWMLGIIIGMAFVSGIVTIYGLIQSIVSAV